MFRAISHFQKIFRVGQEKSIYKNKQRSFKPFLEKLEDRLLLTSIAWIGQANDKNWSDPKNWQRGMVPGFTDSAIFDAKTPGINNNNLDSIVDKAFMKGSADGISQGRINGLTIKANYTGKITIDTGNTLLIDGYDDPFTGKYVSGLFQQYRGTITGPGNLIINSRESSIWAGGVESGTGTTYVSTRRAGDQATSFLAVSDSTSTPILDGRKFQIGGFQNGRGEVDWQGGQFQVKGKSTITVWRTGRLVAANSGMISQVGQGNSRLNDFGLIKKTVGGTTTINIYVRIDGKDLQGPPPGDESVIVEKGSLKLAGGGLFINRAVFLAKTGAKVIFSGDFVWDQSTQIRLRGPGEYFIFGSVENKAIHVAADNLTLSGKIDSGSMEILYYFNWNSGSILGASIDNRGTATIGDSSLSGFFLGSPVLGDKANLKNQDVIILNRLVMKNKAQINNFNVFVIKGTIRNRGDLDAQNRRQFSYFYNYKIITKEGGGSSLIEKGILFENVLDTALIVVDGATLKIPSVLEKRGLVVERSGGKFDTDGLYDLAGGSFWGSAPSGALVGDVLNEGGNIQPGGPGQVGNLTLSGIHGNYTQTVNGGLTIDIGANGYDQFTIQGNAIFAGGLAINFLKGFAPTSGSYQIINLCALPTSCRFWGWNR
jgi:hypothetical protein